MGLFSAYQQRDKTPEPEPTTTAEDFSKTAAAGKTRRTPTRAEAEAARRDRIHPKLTPKELKKAERDADRVRRGRNLREFEERPERVLMRNYVDSRWTLTEFMWPFLVVMLVLSIVGSGVPQIVIGVTLSLWALLLAALANVWWFWRGFKRELRVRYPSAKYNGLLWAMASRMMAMRRVRTPGPMIQRGQSY